MFEIEKKCMKALFLVNIKLSLTNQQNSPFNSILIVKKFVSIADVRDGTGAYRRANRNFLSARNISWKST